MVYFPTGCDRDSYIAGVRPGGGAHAPHNVAARRDNLPDNVFAYLKEKVTFEQFEANRVEEARLRNKVMNSTGRGGKRIPQDTGNGMEELELTESSIRRHLALRELYMNEAQQWEGKLNAKGLCISKE
jgi:hypothetical protein